MKAKMTKTKVRKRTRTARPKTLHHKLTSFFRGRGGIYVILILALIITGAVVMTGGVSPTISRDVTPNQVGQVDSKSIGKSAEKSLQLNALKFTQTTPTPTPNPATPTPVACLNKVAINLVLDVSTSMNSDGKIVQLNEAMKSFVGQLQPETVVAATEFAGLASFSNGTKILLSPTRFNTTTNKDIITNALTHLRVQTDSANDGTYMRNAFATALKNVSATRNAYASQGYKFVTILFTDGVPETQYTDHNCEVEFQNPYLCFARAQDPRTDLTGNMKKASDKVYAVGIYSGARELQAYTQAKTLLADIASSPSYATNSKSPSALTSLFDSIINSVCD
jgi:uncharacterized protein YegL